jgi:predicted DNA-binding antitoxin AbrB/MazE fold protein
MTVRAIYRNGVFEPQQAVGLPENSEVEVTFPADDASLNRNGSEEIFEILSRRYNTGQTDAAARHDEHHS